MFHFFDDRQRAYIRTIAFISFIYYLFLFVLKCCFSAHSLCDILYNGLLFFARNGLYAVVPVGNKQPHAFGME